MTHNLEFILIACTNPVVIPEATHAAAATQREVKHLSDPRELARYIHDAYAVIVDSSTAAHVAATGRSHRIYYVAPEPGPIDFEAALRSRAVQAFILPAESTRLLQTLAADAAAPADATALRIAVVGASGGVGTSTLAVALARTVSHSQDAALLIDAISHSGGLDLLMGLESAPGARWPDVSVGTGTIDATGLASALPTSSDGITVLSTTRSQVETPFRLQAEAVDRMVSAAASGFHVIIVDAPAHNIPQSVDVVVLLVAAEVRSAAAAAEICAELRARGTDVLVVLRHRQWSGLSAAEIERITRADVITELPTIKNLTKTTEVAGLPTKMPKPLAVCAADILSAAGW